MNSLKYRKMIIIALLAAVSLGIYALESLIPPIVPVPGVKLGLANVITLICIYILGSKPALALLMVRIALSAFLFGHPISLIFSLCGGISSYLIMILLKRIMVEENIWAISVFGAFAHNFGQIVTAVIITNQLAVAYYFLFLILSSVITGVFTGLCAQNALKNLMKINFVKNVFK